QRRVARLLAAQARLPRRMARPPGEGGPPGGRVGRRERGVLLPRPARRAGPARATARALVARAPVPPVSRFPGPGLVLAAAIAAYLAVLLAVDTQVGIDGQRALGALTWLVLAAVLTRFPPERRALALGVVCFATIGEVTGSLLWGVYS